MHDISKTIADQIQYSSSTLSYNAWLEEEVNDLALKIAGLDEFHFQAVLPLVQIAAAGEADLRHLALILGIEEAMLEGYLQSLCDFGFIKETQNGYTATQLGEQAFKGIGKKMVIRERFELKRRLEQLEKINLQLIDF